jgi:hypothetical protein
VAIKDPNFSGYDSFKNYTLIQTKTIEENIKQIREKVLENKSPNDTKVIFYSVEDSKSMRFLREQSNGKENACISDFRW